MTNPNWWDVEPYLNKTHCSKPAFHRGECNCTAEWYDIKAIIAEVEKRGETTAYFDTASESMARIYTCKQCLAKQIREKHLFCPHCGAKIIWS